MSLLLNEDRTLAAQSCCTSLVLNNHHLGAEPTSELRSESWTLPWPASTLPGGAPCAQSLTDKAKFMEHGNSRKQIPPFKI